MPNGNVQIAKDCYAAFQANDSDRLFGAMSEDVDWESVGRRSDFPTLGPRKGKAAVREFFQSVADSLEFHSFSPREFHAVSDIVFVLGSYEATVRKTGRRVASEWLHVFRVKNGKVARFREFTDTARFAEALRG